MDKSDIRSLREGLGFSKVEFAALIPVDPITIWRWEKGDSKPTPLAEARMAQIAKMRPKIHKVSR